MSKTLLLDGSFSVFGKPFQKHGKAPVFESNKTSRPTKIRGTKLKEICFDPTVFGCDDFLIEHFLFIVYSQLFGTQPGGNPDIAIVSVGQ